ncbi:hypothetical protein [Hymenobacter sp. H14-R3]|uniref:hypothetical protein n=1 Tax=Hymenobacter sp. H14-R3 TaxID=3046308 RepID=UPI0024BB196D|nr:hypothetical protein [Hymenobacter sp. H14-R3]
MTTKAKEYRKSGYSVVEHEREHNGFLLDDGYHVYFVTHLFEPPIYLAEWNQHYATGIIREIAVDALRALISAAK